MKKMKFLPQKKDKNMNSNNDDKILCTDNFFKKKILNTNNVEIFYTLFQILAMYLLLSSLY